MLFACNCNISNANRTNFKSKKNIKSPVDTGVKVAKIINNNSKSKSIWHITRDFLTELIDTYTY